MLITFSGLDGAGKSTLIDCLRSELQRRGRTVTVLHMNDDLGIYPYVRRLREWVRCRVLRLAPTPPPSYTIPRPKTVSLGARLRYRIIWNKPLRRVLYLGDVVLLLCYRLYIERLRGRVFVMDRYFYDTLVDVSNGHSIWPRLLALLTPTPTVAVFIDISAHTSIARKGEYTIEYLRQRETAYQNVFQWVPGAIVLGNQDLEATKRTLLQAVFTKSPRPIHRQLRGQIE